jgi:hypothetical protein
VSAVFVYLAQNAKPPKSAEIEAFTFSNFERAVRRLETQLGRLESKFGFFRSF